MKRNRAKGANSHKGYRYLKYPAGAVRQTTRLLAARIMHSDAKNGEKGRTNSKPIRTKSGKR
jgi:hypothetical protein